jgi:hypothetical protein
MKLMLGSSELCISDEEYEKFVNEFIQTVSTIDVKSLHLKEEFGEFKGSIAEMILPFLVSLVGEGIKPFVDQYKHSTIEVQTHEVEGSLHPTAITITGAEEPS